MYLNGLYINIKLTLYRKTKIDNIAKKGFLLKTIIENKCCGNFNYINISCIKDS